MPHMPITRKSLKFPNVAFFLYMSGILQIENIAYKSFLSRRRAKMLKPCDRAFYTRLNGIHVQPELCAGVPASK